jgi:N-acetylglucosamine-6-phosphate deacetylase
MNASAEGLHRSASFARNGITARLPNGAGQPDQYQHATKAIDDLMADQRTDLTQSEARVGRSYEGPFVNDQQCGPFIANIFGPSASWMI